MVAGFTSCACAVPKLTATIAAAQRPTAPRDAAVRRFIPFLPGSDAKWGICFKSVPRLKTILLDSTFDQPFHEPQTGEATLPVCTIGLPACGGREKVRPA